GQRAGGPPGRQSRLGLNAAAMPPGARRDHSAGSERAGATSEGPAALRPAKTAHAVRSPATFTLVRHIPSRWSTPRMIAIPSTGMPALANTVERMMMPAPGADGVPIEAATVVTTTRPSAGRLI